MAVTRAVEVDGPQRTIALASKPGDSSNVRPPPLPSMRVPKGSASAAVDEHSEVKPAKTRQVDTDAAREWAQRAAETKARIAAAEEREWLAQLAKVKATATAVQARGSTPEPSDEEAEWRALRETAALAEQREWEVAMARARAAVVSTPRAKPPTRPTKPGRPTAVQAAPITPAAASTPLLARAPEGVFRPAPALSSTAIVFTPFGHVVQATASAPSLAATPSADISFTPFGHVARVAPVPALPRGNVVAWP